jgi:hypothetical protein
MFLHNNQIGLFLKKSFLPVDLIRRFAAQGAGEEDAKEGPAAPARHEQRQEGVGEGNFLSR